MVAVQTGSVASTTTTVDFKVRAKTPPARYEYSVTDSSAVTVAIAADGTRCWRAGYHGVCVRSKLGAPGWEVMSLQSPAHQITGLAFADDGRSGWAVDPHGAVYATADAGSTWVSTSLDPGSRFADVFVSRDGRRVLIPGSGGTVWSIDGGPGERHSMPFPVNLVGGFCSADCSHVWVVGDDYSAYASADAGRNWKRIASIGERQVLAIGFFDDNQRGSAVLADGIAWTADGGEHWGESEVFQPGDHQSEFHDLTPIRDSSEGWAVGSQGAIIRTVDGGETWWTESIGHPTPLERVAFSRNGELGYAAGPRGGVWIQRTAAKYPVLTRVDVDPGLTHATLSISWTPADPTSLSDSPKVEVFFRAASLDSSRLYLLTKEPARLSSNPQALHLDLAPNNNTKSSKYALVVRLREGSYVANYELGTFTATSWVEQVPGGMATTVAVIALATYLAFVVVSYRFFPSFLLRLRLLPLAKAVDAADVPGKGPIIFLIDAVTLTLMLRPRVLAAWATENANVAGTSLASLKEFKVGYTPLPVTLGTGSGQRTVEAPAAALLGELLEGQNQVIHVLGVGGSGKTTLLAECCRWMLGGALDPGGIPTTRVPLWIDSDFTDLEKRVNSRLKEELGFCPDDALRDALIDSGRLILVFDSVSEKDEETRRAVEGVFGIWPRATVFMSSRRELPLPKVGETVRPLPLDSLPVLSVFLNDELARQDGARIFPTAVEQVALVTLILKALRHAVTPLLASTFVRVAINRAASSSPLEGLPSSIPEVYLALVNTLFKEDKEMIAATISLARQVLSGVSVPGKITEWELREKPDIHPLLREPKTIDSMIEAGLVISVTDHQESPNRPLKFALDPVAEYLAAYGIANACGRDSSNWGSEVSAIKASKADGLLEALKITNKVYANELGWPTPNWDEFQAA
jgi:photosystem II stability/assembly factor-like uncharacterized protein